VAHSGGQAPDINDLVAIAPDGKSVAYVDDYAPPGIIMVSDDNGVMHDPIPIPVPDMPAQEAGVTSVDRGMRWFAGAFAWKRNDAGQWEVAPRAAAAGIAQPAHPVEELFLDAEISYRTCFAPTNALCLRTWKRVIDNDTRQSLADGYTRPYEYVPVEPVQAFGGKVLHLYAGTTRQANYAFSVDAPPAQVSAQLIARLTARKMPFVRSDQCPRRADGSVDCAVPLQRQLGWQAPIKRTFLALIEFGTSEQQQVFFVLPTQVVAINADADGNSWIQTVGRYNAARQKTEQ
jgi:hypothetical protein